MRQFDPTTLAYANRFDRFQDLMPYRVHDILLVSSVYDSFILEEDGRLEEGLINEYMDLNLVHMPRMLRASTGSQALALAKEGGRFGLIITTMRLGDMSAIEFVREVKEAGLKVPVVLLTYDYRELQDHVRRHGVEEFERVFLWQGDYRILIAIVKSVEDRLNVFADTEVVGVQSIIVIEDNVRYYSSFLPLIYGELMRHSQDVLSESVNLSHKILRMRARPKILVCETYEEAWSYYERLHENVLGVISDIRFPRGGREDPKAGIEFARNVRALHPDIPILLQSSEPANEKLAESLDVSFVLKDSPLMLKEVRQFMREHLSFGDFVFKDDDGVEVARASDLRSLEHALEVIPDDSLLFHSERNHFSNWLKARTEFWLAHELRPRRVSDYASVDELRRDLIRRLRDWRRAQQRGTIVDFDPDSFDPLTSFARIGGGSLGGKGRGLAFLGNLIENYGLEGAYEGVRIGVPPAVVLGTDVFDRFLDENALRDFAISCDDDDEIRERFLEVGLPKSVMRALRAFIALIDAPLSVRSSSLLEDSQHQPFAGVYSTFMLPNNGGEDGGRLADLLTAVKLVYASTFYRKAKVYMDATSYRLEEEKMAVVVQRLVGAKRENRFYPDFSGVARSHNFYPCAPSTSEDGIASVALGLGAFVVDGGCSYRFSPKYPRHQIQFSTIEDMLNYAQRQFFALELDERDPDVPPESSFTLTQFDLNQAEEDGTLARLASTYSPDNDAVYDGLRGTGVRIVTFAPILKERVFPLPDILLMLLDLGRWSMSAAVEIEFAVNLATPEGEPKEFSILQMRPMVVNYDPEEVETDGIGPDEMVVESCEVLGNGVMKDIRDIVTIKIDGFERSSTREVAQEISLFNYELSREGTPYILIGVGRWGSADPWLGIPVNWEQISGASVIVESSFRDLRVTPSQGSHFFQNLSTMRVGYFTIDDQSGTGSVDWDWLAAQPVFKEREHTRHIRLKKPLIVKMDGRVSHGVILKP